MNRSTALLVTLIAAQASAREVTVDLGPEKIAFDRQVRNRTLGLSLTVGAVAASTAAVVGYVWAINNRDYISMQQVPVDTVRRQQYADEGRAANGVGLAGAVLGVALVLGSAYFLSISF